VSGVDPEASYRRDSVGVLERFDDVETTISHLFRAPHPALRGRTFGGALFDALVARRAVARPHVIELGGGTGALGKAMVEAARGRQLQLDYQFVDLSLRLARAQRSANPQSRALVAHAERLPFYDESVSGLFLCNEVIADLRVEPSSSAEGQALCERYRLDSPGALLNVGALRFVEEVARVLASGASACLTEFGGDFAPSPVRLYGRAGRGDHVEHSIHFGHLARAASALGLGVERVLLADLLEVDRTQRVASYHDVMRLRRFVPSLPVLAHPKAVLEARHPVLRRIFHFEFPEVGSRRFPDPGASGGFCQLFWALVLKRS
jgi:SAM-dependent methyltransferase